MGKIVKKENFPISQKEEKTIKEYLEKRICKIYCNEKVGTGFFCIISLNESEKIRVLITGSPIIGEKDFYESKEIKLTLNNDIEKKGFKLDKGRIKYTNSEFCVTIIEIKEEDKIEIQSFFELDDNIFKNKAIYKNKYIYLLEGIEMTFSVGKIEELDEKYGIIYSCDIK